MMTTRKRAGKRTASMVLVAALVVSAQILLLGDSGNASFPGPNGKLAYSMQVTEGGSGQFKIFVQNPDGTGQVSLSVIPAQDFEPTWSPDGTRIAFAANVPSEGRQIGVMNSDGSGRVMITGPAAPQNGGDQPAWAPSGDKLAFAGGGIHVMSADGTGSTALTTSGTDAQPAWSPDGQKIAFARNGNIYVMQTDGSQVQPLTSATSSARFGNPDWSPDGTRLVVHCADGPGTSICVMNSDGSGLTGLTSSQADFYPVWSPQGDQIAFERFTNAHQDVWIVNADGTNGHSLAGGASAYPGGISWGPVVDESPTSSSSTTSSSTTSSSTTSTTTSTTTSSTTTTIAVTPQTRVCSLLQGITKSFPFLAILLRVLSPILRCAT
ncbi:MAG: TolB protein [Acidimicrobiaceae bacterium]|jgi:Tol biopolymer transport system component|nr:TolB protein [Acidimicrobiaceae bacterium]